MKSTRKIITLASAMMLSAVFFVGCGEKTQTMKDREGTEFTIPKEINTIISTAPSNTEVLVGLGLADKLVATDNYSSDVEGVKEDLPKIDLMNPDAEKIIELNPDIIIASGHNKIGSDDPFALVKEAGIPVAYIPSSYSIEGIYGDIDFMSKLTGTEAKGQEIIDNMKKEVDEIKAISEKITDKKKVFFDIGSGGQLYTFGKDTFLNEMLNTVGAENIFANEKSWITATPESVIEANPDVILINSPDVKIEDIKNREGWENVTAVKEGQIYRIDKNTSSRSSQNAVKALRQIAEAVYPNEYK